MQSKRYIFLILILSLPFFINAEKLTDFVDTFIGTGGHGHTYPGSSMPFGMVQLSPDTRINNWDACSGYHYSDNTVLGFSHTHLSGTGIGDYGDIRFMPTVGKLLLLPGDEKNPKSGYRSRFSHNSEFSYPGYYRVLLADYKIGVELSVTKRAGIQRYKFNEKKEGNVIVDLFNAISRETVIESSIEVIGNNSLRGMRRTRGWARDHVVYFYTEFSKPFKRYIIRKDGDVTDKNGIIKGKSLIAAFVFDTGKDKTILVKTGISAVDLNGAENNLKTEIPNWDFERIKKKAENTWERALSRIKITDENIKNKRVFYTSLYHSFLTPNLFMDIDGRYRGIDRKIHRAKNFTNYTVFSLWDTFRALHPLFTIIERKRTVDLINSLLKRYEEGGILPIWELAGNYTNCMIGYHAVPVIVDAFIKGIRNGYDNELAFKAIKHSAMADKSGLKLYKKYGYIPSDKDSESVSRTLEYAYDDWCISVMAKEMSKEKDLKLFNYRAQFYKNIFSKEVGFMRPRGNGFWKAPFNPKEVDSNFTEANSWQYSFFVPQDVSELIEIMGGEHKFEQNLDKLFSEDSKTTGRQQSDITGLVGQYAHGNEPSHHMAYLYNFIGKPYKTQKIVRKIMDEMYSDEPDGLCGNEDCGQMSAWFVFSSIGFYPVTPGSDEYIIGSPIFEKTVINLENGNKFIVKTKNPSKKNKYIESVRLNEKRYMKSYIKQGDIMNGGILEFIMSDKPNEDWGKRKNNKPIRKIEGERLVPVPYFIKGKDIFNNSTVVEIKSDLKDARIYFTLDGSDPNELKHLYKNPLIIKEDRLIKAIAVSKDGERSRILSGKFHKVKNTYKIKSFTDTTSLYTAGGPEALIDGLRGKKDFRLGGWRGYQKTDLDVIVDIGEVKKLRSVSVGFLQDNKAWIFFPKRVRVSLSLDGKNFKEVTRIKNDVSPKLEGSMTKDFKAKLNGMRARYIKIIGESIMDCPKWHKGYGFGAYIFTDEISFEFD